MALAVAARLPRPRRASRRVQRPDVARIRLTERDRWLLEALSKMRFLETGQLARLGFDGSRWAATKRLRKLLDGGLVRVWVRSLSEENVYSLAPRGAGILERDVEVSAPVPRGLDGHLDHLLAINQVRIAMALGLPEGDGELAWWRSDWELDRGRSRVVPDALFGVRWEEGERVFALEIENESRSPRKFLRKVLGYSAMRHRGLFGLSDVEILVVAKDVRWGDRYREAVGSVLGSVPVWFAALAEVEEEAAGAIWRCAEVAGKYSLRALRTARKGLVPRTPTSRDG